MPDLNNIPSLYDRTDGGVNDISIYSNPLGTYTPSGMIVSRYSGQGGYFFEEDTDSPEIEQGEQMTITHKFTVDYYTGTLLQNQHYRGYLMVDSLGNFSRVLSSKLVIKPRTGNPPLWSFIVVSEGTSWGQPPDEFNINVVTLNPVAEKHPRYSTLSYQERFQIRNTQVGDFFTQQQMVNIVNSLSGSMTEQTKKEALELLYKKFKGENNFYLSAFQLDYTQYFWTPQIINPGGYIEDPIFSGNIPLFFWGTGYADVTNIFSQVAQFNQNLYPNYGSLTSPPYGLSWLRQTDQLTLNRTWWKLKKSWIGAPLGQWDNEWYSTNFQPYQTGSAQGGIYVLN